MKKIIATSMIACMLLLTACKQENNEERITIKDPDKVITIIENKDKETIISNVTVDKIVKHANVGITDWLDEERVIVSKDNEALGKMSLLELSDTYPKSIYVYNLETKQFELIKEKKDMNLSGTLSSDKQSLLYVEFTLGDPMFYLMNLETKESFPIRDELIAGAMSANWADDQSVIGADYTGGAYLATTNGKITPIKELQGEAPVIIEKIGNDIYYNTNSNPTLQRLNLDTGEKQDMALEQVYDVYKAPDQNQMLVIQGKGVKSVLTLVDILGARHQTIAEGIDIHGVSWSEDQRFITYYLQTDENGVLNKGIYLYDTLTNEEIQIAVDVQNGITIWGPNSKQFVYTEWNGNQYTSSVVYLK